MNERPKPEDWPCLFTQRLNAGDLDAVMELYERDPRFVARSGETLVGSAKIRKALAALIEAKTRLSSRVIRATTVGDVAQRYTDFKGTSVDGSGKLDLAQPAKVCDVLHLDTSTLSRNVERMRANGWLEVVPGEDARTQPFRVTAQGKRLLERAVPAWGGGAEPGSGTLERRRSCPAD